jgi:hypothetical protein
MAIVWNRVTWYSKLLAAIFFIFVIPILTFYIGQKYEETRLELSAYKTSQLPVDRDGIVPFVNKASNDSASALGALTSGIYGIATVGPTCPVERVDNPCPDKPYQGFLIVKDNQNRVITTTKVRDNGRFFFLLPPGQYEISTTSDRPMPSMEPANILVQKNLITRVTLTLDSGIR